MSKYAEYAKELDTAFRTAREAYETAQKKYEAVKDKKTSGKTPKDVLSQNLEKEAWYIFKQERENIWKEFDLICADLKNKMQEEIETDNRANPDEVDNNAIDLMKSGILNANDYYGLVDKYADNGTMLRFIGTYAKEAATDATNRAEREALNVLAAECKNGVVKPLREWNELIDIANYCTGRGLSGQRKTSTKHTTSMIQWWEQLTEKIIAEF